jgi:hypothetical protein
MGFILAVFCTATEIHSSDVATVIREVFSACFACTKRVQSERMSAPPTRKNVHQFRLRAVRFDRVGLLELE